MTSATKKAIFSIMIGHDPAYRYSAATFKRYANKVQADLIIHHKTQFELPGIYIHDRFYKNRLAQTEKFHMATLLNQYEQVLYLDADILITPGAEDIFARYQQSSNIVMLNEGALQDYSKEIGSIQQILSQTAWQSNAAGLPNYYNSGVMLATSKSNIYQHAKIVELAKIFNRVFHYDQTYINYLLQRYQQPVCELDASFNRMQSLGPAAERFNANFIHYAGFGYCNKEGKRTQQMIKDYEQLYGKRSLLEKALTHKDRAIFFAQREWQSIKRRYQRHKQKQINCA